MDPIPCKPTGRLIVEEIETGRHLPWSEVASSVLRGEVKSQDYRTIIEPIESTHSSTALGTSPPPFSYGSDETPESFGQGVDQ
jgi:hypothetical protein